MTKEQKQLQKRVIALLDSAVYPEIMAREIKVSIGKLYQIKRGDFPNKPNPETMDRLESALISRGI